MTKHKDQAVSKLADRLIDKWKKIVLIKTSDKQTDKETKKEEIEKTTPIRAVSEKKEPERKTISTQGNFIKIIKIFI